jgi:lipopolysaccharide transport system ATP-binding protein
MYMRLAFAVAAHLEPEILVVDEVLAVGDLQFQKRCLGRMKEVTDKEGRTVLFVSHNMEAVQRLCGQAFLLDGGRLAEAGPVEAVIRRYIEGGETSQMVYQIRPPADPDAPGAAYQVAVEDGSGKAATSVPVGEPWQARILFRLSRRVEHFRMGLGMRTPVGGPMRTAWTEPYDLGPGEYEAVLREETVVLAPGRYPLIIGLSTHERAFHYDEGTAVLEVAEVSQGVDVPKIANVGLFLNKMKSSLHRRD